MFPWNDVGARRCGNLGFAVEAALDPSLEEALRVSTVANDLMEGGCAGWSGLAATASPTSMSPLRFNHKPLEIAQGIVTVVCLTPANTIIHNILHR